MIQKPNTLYDSKNYLHMGMFTFKYALLSQDFQEFNTFGQIQALC